MPWAIRKIMCTHHKYQEHNITIMIFAYSRETSIDSQLCHSYLFSLAVLGTWGLWHGILFGHNRLFTYNTIQHDTTRYKIICYYMLLTKAGIEHPTPWTNPKFMTRSHRGFFCFCYALCLILYIFMDDHIIRFYIWILSMIYHYLRCDLYVQSLFLMAALKMNALAMGLLPDT